MRSARPHPVASAAAAAALAACTLTTSLDGLSTGDAPVGALDGSANDGDAPADGGGEAPPPVAIGTPVTIATGVDASFAAGGAQHTHLHYAKNAKLWVLFYVSATDTHALRTRASEDFTTWTDGPSMTLPEAHGNDGRNFAVTYLDVAGRDVFHFSVSLKIGRTDRRHVHARGVIDARKLVYENVAEIGRSTNNFDPLDPDGPAVTVIPGGKVVDLSGWRTVDGRVGNVNAFTSTDPDLGAAWAPSFAPSVEVDVVPVACNARAIVPMSSGALAAWEGGDEEPNPSDLRSARFDGVTWAPDIEVGFAGPRFDPNDWGVARIDDANVHAVVVAGSAFAHRFFDGNAWQAGPPMPARPHVGGHGVAVLAHAGEILALALEGASGSLATATLAGGAWSAWSEVVGAGPGRSNLAAYAGEGGVAAVWAESTGGPPNLVGARIR